MRFSERYGYKKVDNSLVWEEVPLQVRNRIWNAIANLFGMFKKDANDFLIKVFDKFLGEDISGLLKIPIYTMAFQDNLFKSLKQKTFNFKWNKFFDFLEFTMEEFPNRHKIRKIEKKINRVLEEEKSAYRIIDGIVTPLIDREQIKEIEKALNPPDRFAPVREHIKNALKHLSDKKEPNYEDSIRESIHAVESLAKIITGKDKSLSGLIQSLKDIPFDLREGFKELYNWSSKNLRHGKSGKELPTGFEEAVYMMVSCSAFVNYVIAKYGKGKLKLKDLIKVKTD